MKTTLIGAAPPYVGADLTDRYSKGCRNIDVCGLQLGGAGTFPANFWEWEWDASPAPLKSAPIIAELSATRCSMLDAPQGLADRGKTIRECERLCAAVGKTGDTRPKSIKRFGGFILSSLDLFH